MFFLLESVNRLCAGFRVYGEQIFLCFFEGIAGYVKKKDGKRCRQKPECSQRV